MYSRKYDDGYFSVDTVSGFNPVQEPLQKLPESFGKLQDLLDRLPVTLKDGSPGVLGDEGAIEKEVSDIPNYLSVVRSIENTPENQRLLSAIFRGYAFVVSGYLLEPVYWERKKSGKTGKARNVVPQNLAQPFVEVSEKLGIFPWLEYTHAYALGNRKKIEPMGKIEWTNLDMCVSFTGMENEKGFIMTHNDIVAKSPNLIKSIWDFQKAVEKKDSLALVDACKLNYHSMVEINKRRTEMWKASDHRKYTEFRDYIMGVKGNEEIFGEGLIYEGVWKEPKAFRGQTGAQDTIIPTEDIFTGVVDNYPNNDLTDYLMELREYRPPVFRSFLNDLKEASKDNLKHIIECNSMEALIYFLGSIDQVYRFRNGHWMFVQKYIMANTKYGKATGGTPITTWIPNQIEATLNRMGSVLELLNKMDDKLSDEVSLLYNDLKEEFPGKCDILRKQIEELSKIGYDAKMVYDLNGKFKEI